MEEQLRERALLTQSIDQAASALADKKEGDLQSLSHDLRSPLSILRTVRLELDGVLTEPEEHQLVEYMEGALAKVEDLLTAFHRLNESGGVLPVNAVTLSVPALADALERRLRAYALHRQIDVSVSRTEDCPTSFNSDPLFFDRVIDNLFINAVRHTEQGRIDVVLGGSPDVFRVSVTDTGRGIAPDMLPQIFRPGVTTVSDGRDGSGFGLGLPSVVMLLDRLGGSLGVSSRPNHGAAFVVDLPRQIPSETAFRTDSLDATIERVVRFERGE